MGLLTNNPKITQWVFIIKIEMNYQLIENLRLFSNILLQYII